MAKVTGIVALQGTLDGVTFYKLNGKQVARMAGGGFNGHAIRTKASMQRVRENGIEFGHCSRVNKVFRQAINTFHEAYKFTSLHGHLMTLFTQLKNLDSVSIRGQRRVDLGLQTDVGKALLKTFNFTPQSQLAKVFPFEAVFDGSNFSMHYPNIDMSKVLFPDGVTHLKLLYGVLDIDFEHLTYTRYAASPLLIDTNYGGGLLQLGLATAPILQHTGVVVLGMRLYQELDGVLYALQDDRFVGFQAEILS